MSNALLIHDLADAIMRERLQQAAQQALLTQLRAAERPSSLDHLPALIRRSVAGGLRGLAVRGEGCPGRPPGPARAGSFAAVFSMDPFSIFSFPAVRTSPPRAGASTAA